MNSKLTRKAEVLIYRHKDSYVHNPVLEILPNGEMLCVFREAPRRRVRTHIDMSSVAAMIRSTDGGRSWDSGTRQVILEMEGNGIQDPSIRRLKDGTLICNYFVWTAGGQNDFPLNHPWLQLSDAEHYSWTTGSFTIRSTDDGKTWEQPVAVTSPTGECTATADPVLELANGELLIPIEMEALGETTKTGIARSRDQGRSWVEPVIAAFDALGHYKFHETTLLQVPSGKIIAIHRVHQTGEYEYGWYLYQTDSEDNGRTWTTPRRLPMWGGPAHLLQLQSGSILCVYGYRRPPYGARACLSHDKGETWDIANEFILFANGIDADVGYPTSAQLGDGTIITAWYSSERDNEAKPPGAKFSIFAYDRPLTYLGGTIYREE